MKYKAYSVNNTGVVNNGLSPLDSKKVILILLIPILLYAKNKKICRQFFFYQNNLHHFKVVLHSVLNGLNHEDSAIK